MGVIHGQGGRRSHALVPAAHAVRKCAEGAKTYTFAYQGRSMRSTWAGKNAAELE